MSDRNEKADQSKAPIKRPGGRGGKMRAPVEKPKNVKKTLLGLWRYVKLKKTLLILAFLMVILNTGASLAGTAFMQPLIDNFLAPTAAISTAARIAGLAKGIGIIAAFFMVGVVAVYLQNKLMLHLAQSTINRIRKDLFDHLQKLPVRYFDTHTHGELMSRFTNDVDTLNDAMQNSLTSFFSSVITLVGILGLMVTRSIPLTLVALLTMPLMIFIIGKIMKASGKYYVAQQGKLGEVNGYVEEIMTGQKVVKVFNYEDRARDNFDQLNTELKDVASTAQFYGGLMMPLSRTINMVVYALVAAVGGALTIFSGLSVGALVVFLQLTQQFGRPLNEASSQYNAVITAIAGAERIFAVMAEKPEEKDPEGAYRLEHGVGRDYYWVRVSNEENEEGNTDDGQEPVRVPVKGDVRFHDVYFGYDEDKTILKGISLYAKPGQKIAFVGSTGAGKTTIINLLTRFYDIDKGSITVDGIPIRQIEKDSLRRAMSVVLQDTHLFTGSIRENIRYGRPSASDEEVEVAARLASAHSFIKKLPAGYDTIIEGDGANLSQGQRQLLNIARAAVADAPILILDEATSSVDTRTEKHIERGLDRLMEDRTTFVIAHRLSTVRNSNAIMVMEQGEIIERGTHDDLLDMKGRYYQLYTGAVELD